MIKTFIYGVPHGFDFYEKDAELNDYFKGFYISSRRGRRLMINRRENGDTIYSYLRYGLKEVDRQPLHSFFGMSLVIDNYQFCPNFKVMLEWFDYLFNKLVNEHNLIKKNEDGIHHYVVHKFDENSADVEWLKSNLPNILTQAGQTETANYDNSFVDGKAGQVVSFNNPVGENRLLETFKRYRWLSISSEIVERQNFTSGDPVEIELNFEELNGMLNEFNQQLLPIAVDISKGSYADLKRMDEEVQDISNGLSKYIPTIDDPEEKEKFGGLDSKYDSLKDSIGALLSKFTTSTKPFAPQPPKQETQYCFSCKQNKPLSHFRSSDATKCLECEEQDRRRTGAGTIIPKGYKVCISCGKKKPARFFNQIGTDICDDCAKTHNAKPIPVQEGFFDKFGKIVMSKGFLGALASIAVIVGIAFAAINLPNGCSTQDVLGGGGEGNDTISVNVPLTGEAVDRGKLENLIASGDFKAVYDYVKDKNDVANYKRSLKDTVNRHLWSIVDSSNTAQEDLAKFYIVNKEFLDFIGFTENDKLAWEEIVNDYNKIWDILKKPKVTDADLKLGNEILEKHSGLFPAEWSLALSEKPKEIVRQAQISKKEDLKDDDASEQKLKKATFTLTYTQASDGKEITINIDGSKIGFDGLIGTYATVKCKNGKVKENNKTSCSVHLTDAKKYTIKLDNSIVLTITAIEKNNTKQGGFHKQ